MSLLDGLIGQIAQSAIQNQMGNSMGMNPNMGGMSGMGMGQGSGLDGMLGSVLGGALGGGMGNQMGMSNGMGGMGGGMGSILGSLLGGGMGGQQQQSGFGGAGKSMLMAALIPLALSFIQRNGGLSGALSKITGMGHNQQANSWMSTDQANLPLDPNAVNQLFDQSELQQVADQTGVDTNEVANGMANLLPQVFDNLTPNGDTSNEHEANSEIDDILRQFTQARG